MLAWSSMAHLDQIDPLPQYPRCRGIAEGDQSSMDDNGLALETWNMVGQAADLYCSIGKSLNANALGVERTCNKLTAPAHRRKQRPSTSRIMRAMTLLITSRACRFARATVCQCTQHWLIASLASRSVTILITRR